MELYSNSEIFGIFDNLDHSVVRIRRNLETNDPAKVPTAPKITPSSEYAVTLKPLPSFNSLMTKRIDCCFKLTDIIANRMPCLNNRRHTRPLGCNYKRKQKKPHNVRLFYIL